MFRFFIFSALVTILFFWLFPQPKWQSSPLFPRKEPHFYQLENLQNKVSYAHIYQDAALQKESSLLLAELFLNLNQPRFTLFLLKKPDSALTSFGPKAELFLGLAYGLLEDFQEAQRHVNIGNKLCKQATYSIECSASIRSRFVALEQLLHFSLTKNK